MKANHDILFKVGLGLQLLLIPIAFLWRFSPEANYYNWVLVFCLTAVIVLSFWPQVVLIRLKRLRAMQVQFVAVGVLLAISWLSYGYFYNFTRANCTPSVPLYSHSQAMLDQYKSVAGGKKYCNFDTSLSDRSLSLTIYHVNLLGGRWAMLLGPGVSVPSAIFLTALFIAIPASNLYRYRLDKKRVHGIKKDELFI